ncbi:MAG: 2Fe-2S iron-sulfur cluster binding domain-containing protein [Planctomycetota bacterium]
MGTCGTCSVEVQGAVSSMTTIEQWRLRFPPHRSENPLRLACQCRVLGDLKIRKHAGLWGNKLSVSDSES